MKTKTGNAIIAHKRRGCGEGHHSRKGKRGCQPEPKHSGHGQYCNGPPLRRRDRRQVLSRNETKKPKNSRYTRNHGAKRGWRRKQPLYEIFGGEELKKKGTRRGEAQKKEIGDWGIGGKWGGPTRYCGKKEDIKHKAGWVSSYGSSPRPRDGACNCLRGRAWCSAASRHTPKQAKGKFVGS